jgi:GT2 family glycosyltransferase
MRSETALLPVEQGKNGATIVIVTYNSAQTILECLRSVENSLRPNDNVVLVDNRSNDRTLDLIRDFILHRAQYGLIENHANLGYAAAANQGALAGSNPYIVFLNPDTIVTPHWLDQLVFHLQVENNAAVGPVSNCVAGLQKAAIHLPEAIEPNIDPQSIIAMLWRKHQRQCIPTKLLVGFCLMIKRHVFDEVGGLDDKLFLGNDDLDICWRLTLAGYQLVVAKDTMVFHKGQESFKSELKSTTDELVQESTDYLYYKLMKYYGAGNVPSAKQLWGMDWFRPSCRFEENLPLTSIVILTCDQLDYTRQCLNSIFARTDSPFELIIVDNGSRDGTVDYLSSLSRSDSACLRIKLIENKENQGFAKGCNQGLAEARGDYLLLLNNDVVVTTGWLSRLVGALQNNNRLGFVGPMSNYVSGPQWVSKPSYNVRTLEGLEQFAALTASRHCGQVIRCSRIVGFCLLIKKAVIDTIGGLDSRYGLGNFEDDDFCLRALLAGFQGGIVKDCFVHHFGGRTFFGNNLHYEEQLKKNWSLFKEKWKIPPGTPLGPKYQVPLESMKFDPEAHVVPIDKHGSLKGSQIVHRSPTASSGTEAGTRGATSLQEYCHGLNGNGRWLTLDPLSKANQKAPYMVILDDVSIIGPLLLHHGPQGRLRAIHIEQDKVSDDFCGSSAGLSADPILPEHGTMRRGSYLLLWGLRTDNFWHWTMEILIKVIMARACGFNGYYIVPPRFNHPGFIRESLEILGISPDRVCVYDGQPWRVEQLYLPQHIEGMYHIAQYPVLIDQLRSMLLDPCTAQSYSFDRIYLARENEKQGRRVINETQLMDILFRFGFSRIVMERFSLKDQIAIAAGANCIVAPHGAGMVHCIFMPPRSTVIELFPTTYINPCMLPVVEYLEHRYFMIPSSHLSVGANDDFEAYLQAVEVTLKREFKPIDCMSECQ